MLEDGTVKVFSRNSDPYPNPNPNPNANPNPKP